MCAIIGLSVKQQGFNGSLLRLLNESKIRGLHAFGISYFNKGQIYHHKFLNLIELKMKITTLEADKILIHCRYSTSGDYKVIENNQPVVSQHGSLIFNGIVSMASKQQNEALYNEKYDTDNDGEIILKMVEKGQNYLAYLAKFGSFAGGTLDSKGTMKMFRNYDRPMHRVENEFGTWYCSTRDIFARAGFNETEECEALRIYEHH